MAISPPCTQFAANALFYSSQFLFYTVGVLVAAARMQTILTVTVKPFTSNEYRMEYLRDDCVSLVHSYQSCCVAHSFR